MSDALELPLDVVGLRVGRRPTHSFDDKGGTPPKPSNARPPPGWLGVELASGPKLVVSAVREGSPAHRAGVYAEDEIVAEDGFRIDRSALWERLVERGPGGTLRLTLFRRDELVQVEVPLAPAPLDALWVEPLPDATPAQRARFEGWCGAPFPGR